MKASEIASAIGGYFRPIGKFTRRFYWPQKKKEKKKQKSQRRNFVPKPTKPICSSQRLTHLLPSFLRQPKLKKKKKIYAETRWAKPAFGNTLCKWVNKLDLPAPPFVFGVPSSPHICIKYVFIRKPLLGSTCLTFYLRIIKRNCLTPSRLRG